MMIIRIHALYGGSRGVTMFVAALLMAQVGVQAWLLANAIRKCTFLDETQVSTVLTSAKAVPQQQGETSKFQKYQMTGR